MTELSLRRTFARDLPPLIELERRINLTDGAGAYLTPQRLRELAADDSTWWLLAVHEPNPRPRGYLVYRVRSYSIELVRLAVHPTWRRQGVASYLISSLITHATELGYARFTGLVPEPLLPAQLFFRHLGFKCVNTLPIRNPQSAIRNSLLFTYRPRPRILDAEYCTGR